MLYCYHLYNDYSIYAPYFSTKTTVKNIFKYVNFKFGFYNLIQILARNRYVRPMHHAKAFLKSTFETIWKDHEQSMLRTSRARFRGRLENSPQAFRGYQIITGKFYPKNLTKKATVVDSRLVDEVKKAIESGKYKYICLSDNTPEDQFESAKAAINASFEKIYPNKSSFEK